MLLVKQPLTYNQKNQKLLKAIVVLIEGKKMTLMKSKIQSIYHSSKEDTWTGVNWSKVEKMVDNLQHRITKAAKRGDYRKVKNLQRLLTKHSFSASLKAVHIVTQQHLIKEKLGINNQLCTTPQNKIQAALELRKKADKKFLKKGVSDTGNDNQYSFNKSCISNYAHQALWNIALLPTVKSKNNLHSYKFEYYENCWETNTQLRLLLHKPNSPQWVLNLNIKSSLDKINPDWLLNNILSSEEKKILQSSLNEVYSATNNSKLFLNEKNIVQRKVISFTLANLILNELENYLKKIFNSDKVYNKKETNNIQNINMFITIKRSADNFVIISRSKKQLQRVKKAITDFLPLKDLQISEDKMQIRHISQGFDFLGWTFRKYSNGAFLCTISNKSKIKHREEIKDLTKTIHRPELLISKLNYKISSWMNYHHCTNGLGDVGRSMNKYLYERLIKWGLRHHSNKTKKWVFNRYWKHIDGRWTFMGTTKDGKVYKLINYNFIKSSPPL